MISWCMNMDIKDNKWLREALDWLLHIGVAVLAGLLIINFVAQRTIVIGFSMEPTLENGDQLIIEKLTHRFGKLKQGDIVTIYIPEKLEHGKDYIIKRVIGVEGDRVQIKDGKVYVNGIRINEPYTSTDITLPGESQYNDILVGDNQIYVLGDNRLPGASKDSRFMGLIDMKRVKGRAIFRFYPFSKIGTIR